MSTKKIRFLENVSIRWTHRVEAYQQGQEYDIDSKRAEYFVNKGQAENVKPRRRRSRQRATRAPAETSAQSAGPVGRNLLDP